VPVAVYRYLPDGWGLEDPLPPVHTAPVYHYTSLAGVHGLIESNVGWASHVLDLNDPTERLYGWDVIRKRYRESPPAGSSGAHTELANIFDQADDPGTWYPRPFVLSASAAPDSLTQYRLYGQCQVEIVGGTWTATSHRDRFVGDDLLAQWRPVLYGSQAAQPFVDRMLQATIAIMDSVPPEDYEDQGLTSMLALEILALHIKDEAYADEREVRLVFSAQAHHSIAKVRVSKDRLVTFVEAQPLSDDAIDVVRSVRLGPLAGGRRSREAIKLHYGNHSRRQVGLLEFEEQGLDVSLSSTRFTG
jgi:hypothetical protein